MCLKKSNSPEYIFVNKYFFPTTEIKTEKIFYRLNDHIYLQCSTHTNLSYVLFLFYVLSSRYFHQHFRKKKLKSSCSQIVLVCFLYEYFKKGKQKSSDQFHAFLTTARESKLQDRLSKLAVNSSSKNYNKSVAHTEKIIIFWKNSNRLRVASIFIFFQILLSFASFIYKLVNISKSKRLLKLEGV